jgi:hypothetical protein
MAHWYEAYIKQGKYLEEMVSAKKLPSTQGQLNPQMSI